MAWLLAYFALSKGLRAYISLSIRSKLNHKDKLNFLMKQKKDLLPVIIEPRESLEKAKVLAPGYASEGKSGLVLNRFGPLV